MYYVKKRWSNATKQNYNGHIFDSKFEADYARELDLRVKAKDIKGYDKQVVLDLIVNNYKVCTYKIDFIIYHNDGITEYLETKGYATDTWRLKWKLFEALYSDLPDTKLTIVQQGKFRPPKAKRVRVPILSN